MIGQRTAIDAKASEPKIFKTEIHFSRPFYAVKTVLRRQNRFTPSKPFAPKTICQPKDHSPFKDHFF